MSDLNFRDFSCAATGFPKPYRYQCRLACGPDAKADNVDSLSKGTLCQSQLINIPTGLGKTAAVVIAWIWNRLFHSDSSHRNSWPRRLVYCLPMRTLVEQTRESVKEWLQRLNLAWDENGEHRGKVGLHILMGGEDDGEWDLYPECEAILIGTQDMLLSRALNRGYGMSRYRWPMHFGLLNNDCVWVMDETQLMGPGLWTSAQLDWMRRDRFPALLPCVTWWMSATISSDFLDTIDRRNAGLAVPEGFMLGDEPGAAALLDARRPCHLWNQIAVPRAGARAGKKTAHQEDPGKVFGAALAEAIILEHVTGTLSLVVCNTVHFAQMLFDAMARKSGVDAILPH